MAKFKYKYETIKSIKERLEKKAQKDLATIDLEIANKKKEINNLLNQLKEEKKRKINDKAKITELHFYEKYESYVFEQVEHLQEYIKKKMEEREEKMQELLKRTKETKTFEKLKEKHLEEYNKELDAREQKDLDEFALKGFVRK